MNKILIGALKNIAVGIVGVLTAALFLSLFFVATIFIKALVDDTCTLPLAIGGVISILVILFGVGLHIRKFIK